MAHIPVRLLVLSICLFAFGCSSNSTPSDAGGPLGDPAPPTGLTATASATSLQVSLTWDAEAAATSGFQVYRNAGSGEEQVAASRSNAYVDTSPPAGISISYTVRALNTNLVTADSAAAVVLTIPPAPADLAVTSITTSAIAITWTEAMSAVGGDEVSYFTATQSRSRWRRATTPSPPRACSRTRPTPSRWWRGTRPAPGRRPRPPSAPRPAASQRMPARETPEPMQARTRARTAAGRTPTRAPATTRDLPEMAAQAHSTSRPTARTRSSSCSGTTRARPLTGSSARTTPARLH